jgi:hypothetical protein
MRKAGFAATLAAGVGLLGASLFGMTSVDRTLAIAAATPAPSAPSPELVLEKQRDCHRFDQNTQERSRPRV